MNLQFQNPDFLYALFAVAVPIIIHLFNFKKYKMQYFSNLQFIREIEQQTRSKSKLKQLLILTSRILAVVALVFAFARIYIPLNENNLAHNTVKNQVVIYLDNSFSMNAEGSSGLLIENAKQKAISIINSYSPSSDFFIVTNEFKGNDGYSISKDKAIEYLASVDVCPISRNLSDVYNHCTNVFDKVSTAHLYFISDYQKSTSNLVSIDSDTLVNLYLIPVGLNAISNIYIDSCWFVTPYRTLNSNEQLAVKITNRSKEDLSDLPVQLYINDTLRTIGNISMNAYSSEDVVLSYSNTTKGIVRGRIQIDDYPISFDNNFYFNYSIAEKINVLEIFKSSSNKYLETVFADDFYITYTSTNIGAIDYSAFETQNLIIVNEVDKIESGLEFELYNYIQNGGTVLFIPSFQSEINTYNSLFAKMNVGEFIAIDSNKVSLRNIDFNNHIYADVFTKKEDQILLPFVLKYWDFKYTSKSSTHTIVALENNRPFILRTPVNNGAVYVIVCPADLKYSNFVKHPIFVSGLYNIALFTNTSGDIYKTLGNNVRFEFPKISTDKTMYTISSVDHNLEFIPEYSHNIVNNTTYIQTGTHISEAGTYYLNHNKEIVSAVSLNFDRSESNLDFYSSDELNDIAISNKLFNVSVLNKAPELLKDQIKKQKNGLQLWKLMVLLVLIFLLIEVLLLKFMK